MRRITLWSMSTLSALVLLVSYPTSRNATDDSASLAATAATTSSSSSASSESTAETSSSSASSSTKSSTTSSSPATSSATSSATPTASATSTTATKSGTYTGDSVQMRYGPVQVQITVANGKITAIEVLEVPMNDHRDQEINSQAVPILNSEVLSAQSADIDMVGGATITSQAYIQSLQSAIDQAGL